MKTLIGVALAIELVSCSSANLKNDQDRLSSKFSAGYDASSYAAIQVLKELEEELDEEVVSEMNEEDLSDEIENRMEAIVEKHDINQNGIVDESELEKMSDNMADMRIEDFDTNDDGRIDASEKAEIHQRVSKRIKKCKDHRRGKKTDKERMCKKVQTFLSNEKNSDLAKKPMIERILARCEGMEMKGNIPSKIRRSKRCKKLLKVSLTGSMKKRPGLKRLLGTCSSLDTNMKIAGKFGPDAMAVVDVLEKMSEEDSEVSAQISDDDVEMAIDELKKRYLERYDTNMDGKIDDIERTSMISAHKAKQIAKFDKNNDGMIDKMERKMVMQQINRLKPSKKSNKSKPKHLASVCKKLELRASNMNSDISENNPLLDSVMAKCEGIDLDDLKEKKQGNMKERKAMRCKLMMEKYTNFAETYGNDKIGEKIKWLNKKCHFNESLDDTMKDAKDPVPMSTETM